MAEETKQKIEKKVEEKETKVAKAEDKVEDSKKQKKETETKKTEESKPESPAEKSQEAKEEKPKIIPKHPKKDLAESRGQSLHASKKHCMYIGSFIKGKRIDEAISDLQSVISLKKAIPFKGEIPHRKGPMMSGRYPVEASKLFISLLKGLKGNAIQNSLDIDNTVITLVSASWASRPLRKGRVEGKRTNVYIVAKELTSKENKK